MQGHLRAALAALFGLVLSLAAAGETLYQKDGVTLDGSVRIAQRDAAVCQVLEDSHSPEDYEKIKANQGRPLHVWRLDYSAYNGTGRALGSLAAHFKLIFDTTIPEVLI